MRIFNFYNIMSYRLHQWIIINSMLVLSTTVIAGPLHTAVIEKDMKLLGNGNDINQKNEDGMTPLFLAASQGYADIVKLLLNKGAAVTSKEGLSPLHWAGHFGQSTIVSLLLSKGADIEAKDPNGDTVLKWVIDNYRPKDKIELSQLQMVRLLLTKGANIHSRNIAGQTPLIRAIIMNKLAVAKLLINMGADINGKDKSETPPLFYAITYSRFLLVKLLLKREVKLTTNNTQEVFWLHLASSTAGNIRIVRLLLDKGININDKDSSGNTALQYASSAGDLEVVVLLLRKGANKNIRDRNSKTALDFAKLLKRENVIKLLKVN